MGTVRVSCWGGVELGAVVRPLGVITLTATDATNKLSGVLPAGAKVASFYAVEDHFVDYDGSAAPDATAGGRFFVPAGTERDVRLDTISDGASKFAAATP